MPTSLQRQQQGAVQDHLFQLIKNLDEGGETQFPPLRNAQSRQRRFEIHPPFRRFGQIKRL